MDIQMTMQCTVITPRTMETITRVPFYTNKQACENAISRLKMIAHYSSTMMPHITMCKLTELLHHFRLESNGIFMSTIPTVHPLPPTTDAEDKFHHIMLNRPPLMVNNASKPQSESKATLKIANRAVSGRPKFDNHRKQTNVRHDDRDHHEEEDLRFALQNPRTMPRHARQSRTPSRDKRDPRSRRFHPY